MRIISGSHKGRRLSAPKNLPVRPTTDRSKEALFNILQNQYQWDVVAVLDLFSGTGSISYEFASRGVKNVIAVDQNKMCVNYIRKTSEQLEFPSIFDDRVLRRGVRRWAWRARRRNPRRGRRRTEPSRRAPRA